MLDTRNEDLGWTLFICILLRVLIYTSQVKMKLRSEKEKIKKKAMNLLKMIIVFFNDWHAYWPLPPINTIKAIGGSGVKRTC